MKPTKGPTRSPRRAKRASAPTPDGRTVKQIVQEMAAALPDDSTWDEAIYRLEVCRKIAAGLGEAREGRLCTEEEAFRDLDS